MLGKTGLKVSAVGSGVGITPDPEVIARAIDLGVNYFDTARGYGAGESERITGMALKGKRDKVVLASKTDARTRADVIKDMEASLKTLDGNQAVADVAYRTNEVVAIYPITADRSPSPAGQRRGRKASKRPLSARPRRRSGWARP